MERMRRWLSAGTATALIDGAFSGVLAAFFYGSSVSRLFQGVASVPLGKVALDDPRYALVGVAMHVCVAFFWSAVFVLLADHWAALRGVVSSTRGKFVVAMLYGPLIWCVMSLVVIPTLAHRPPTVNFRWYVQFIGHAVFVGLPIVWFGSPRTARNS